MPIRLARFEMPDRLVKDEDSATNKYSQFVAEPFDRGYGHTVGNSLRLKKTITTKWLTRSSTSAPSTAR